MSMRFVIDRKVSSRINRNVLAQCTLDSGSLGPMVALLHRFSEPGCYNAVLNQGEVAYATFTLIVDKNATASPATINLCEASPCYTVSPETYVVFSAPCDPGGLSVAVWRAVGGAKSAVFDSRMLGEGDIFAATLLRPGTYSASNQYGAKCAISLTRAAKGLARQVIGKRVRLSSRAECQRVDCTRESFAPDKVSAETSQPILFAVRTKEPCLRIKVTLEASEDSPAGPSTGAKAERTKVPKKLDLKKTA
ncbi:MAG: hypothetical protein WHS82_02405 [Candidatus Methanosuratincola sp.]